MAYETLVEEIRDVIRRLREEKGEVSLAMLIATSWGQESPWNLVLSAEWMDKKSRKGVIEHVIKLLRKHVSRENWSSVLMVSILKSDDPFVRAINQIFQISDSPANIQNYTINGFEVDRAVILESHPPTAVSASPR